MSAREAVVIVPSSSPTTFLSPGGALRIRHRWPAPVPRLQRRGRPLPASPGAGPARAREVRGRRWRRGPRGRVGGGCVRVGGAVAQGLNQRRGEAAEPVRRPAGGGATAATPYGISHCTANRHLLLFRCPGELRHVISTAYAHEAGETSIDFSTIVGSLCIS